MLISGRIPSCDLLLIDRKSYWAHFSFINCIYKAWRNPGSPAPEVSQLPFHFHRRSWDAIAFPWSILQNVQLCNNFKGKVLLLFAFYLMLSFYWAIRNLGPLGDVKPPSFGCCSIKSAQWFPWEWFWSQFCISFLFSLFRIKFLHSVLAKADLILVYNLSKNYSIFFLLY